MRLGLNGKQFAVLAALVVVSGFAGGLVSERLLHTSDAAAQERPTTTTIFVGQSGLVFRGPDGRALARVGGDGSGGYLDLYNAKEQPAARLRPGSFTGVVEAPNEARAPQLPKPDVERHFNPAYTSQQTWPNDLGF